MTLRLPIISPSDTCSSTLIGSTSKLPYSFIKTPSFSNLSAVSFVVGGPWYGGLWARYCASIQWE